MPQQAGPASEGRASDADWEAPYYRVRAAGFQVLFLVEPDEAIEEVCNVDAEVHLADGSRWSSTIFTLAEVDRLMRSWEASGEAVSGQCFFCADGLIVRNPGIGSMVRVIAGLVASGEFDGVFRRLPTRNDHAASQGIVLSCIFRMALSTFFPRGVSVMGLPRSARTRSGPPSSRSIRLICATRVNVLRPRPLAAAPRLG